MDLLKRGCGRASNWSHWSCHADNSVGRLLGVDFTQKYEMGMTMLGKESVSPHEENVKVTLKSSTKP